MYWKRGNQPDGLPRSCLALLLGVWLSIGGCAKQLTPYGKARQADTIEAYEEFIRTSPNDPRARFAQHRIEVLRSLEAHRGGTVTMPGPSWMASEERLSPGVTPTDARQGPWHLTGAPPRYSAFVLALYHGNEQPIPHTLRVDQQGGQVTYTLQHGDGPNRYYLAAGVPFANFRHLWAAVVARDVGSYESSYGRMGSTADYRGSLVIKVDTGTELLSRTISLNGLEPEDRDLRLLLESMARMHPGDHRIPILR